MSSDVIADMLTSIRNANSRNKQTVLVPHSNHKEKILAVLKDEGFITDYKVMPDEIAGPKKKTLHIYLKYGPNNEKVINKIVRISKPGRRIFREIGKLERVVDGLGIAVLSTSKGVISDRKARELNIGGEVVCKVW